MDVPRSGARLSHTAGRRDLVQDLRVGRFVPPGGRDLHVAPERSPWRVVRGLAALVGVGAALWFAGSRWLGLF